MCSSLVFLYRNTGKRLLRVDSNIPDWGTNITAVNESHHTAMSFCGVVTYTIFLSLIIALVGLVRNSTVLWLLDFQMHRNAFSVYILNLAGADFLFTCFQIGYCFHIILGIYAIPIEFSLFTSVMLNSPYLCGLGILSAISTERCLSVMWPIWYRCQRPRHTSAIICTLLWVLSLVLSLMEGKECGSIKNHWFQWKTLKLLLQRAMQDTPEEEECREMCSSGQCREIKTDWKGLKATLIRHK